MCIVGLLTIKAIAAFDWSRMLSLRSLTQSAFYSPLNLAVEAIGFQSKHPRAVSVNVAGEV